MKSSRAKRQRLMIPSYVSPLRPDVPAIFESLSDDPLTTVLEFVGKKSYRSFGGVNKHCREIYLNTPGMTKETYLYGYAPLSVIKDRCERDERSEQTDLMLPHRVGKGVVSYNRKDVLEWALREQNMDLLNGICNIAAWEGRTDLLDDVWNNIDHEDDKEDIFEELDEYAASDGRLNVLKWFETKGLDINEHMCAGEAARGGYLHILKWLKEEKGLELKRELYCSALHDGSQLNVMKWLREQEVPWYEYTFSSAAWNRNPDILQWLHDEGCPWPRGDAYRVYADGLQPEVVDWLRSNGYSDRIKFED